jgi:hypothetical protein
MKNLITKLSTPLPHREGQGVGLLSLLSLLLLLTLVSCGSDDDNNSQESLQVTELKEVLLDENGQVFFEEMENGDYKIGLLSKEDAIDLVKLYVGNGFNGQPQTYKLDDNKSTVDVTIGGDGVYYSVGFAVQGIPHFRLWMVDEGGNAFAMKHTCTVCGYTWISTVNRCPRTGKKSYHP